ncbi:outer membrane beta-barrel protein [Adhaeribacter aquaticus]|uniref:outer membrane beta-barrel protein n=1 Tax=Adhaeribacter aquaticus TaxID=299567 RepID=UPI00041221DF|nr:outer membrane beta-barrel protein [Adhaeribacter aquaticus]
MKRNTFTLFAFLLAAFVNQLQAQDLEVTPDPATRNQHGSFHFGLTTALNNTWIIIDRNDEDFNKHSQHNTTFKWAPIGVALGYKVNSRHDIQAEVYLSNQGENFTITDGSGKEVGEKRIDLTYLQIPFLWKFTGGDVTRFNVHFGPQLGLLIKGEEVNHFNQTATSAARGGSSKTINQGTYVLARKEKGAPWGKPAGGLNAPDLYAVLGFGVEHDISSNFYLSANLRVNYAFKEIRDKEFTQDQYDFDTYILRHNTYGGLQVGIHYIFKKPQ